MSRYVPGKHQAYFDLLEQLGRPGCAVCALAGRAGSRWLESFAWEKVNDPPTRFRLRESLGFCGAHARELDERAGLLSLALLYEDLLRVVEQEMGSWGRPARRGGRRAPCLACEAAAEQAERSLRTLAEFFGDAELAEAYGGSGGLCVPHGRELARRLREPARSRFIAGAQERVRVLRRELAEVIRKSDCRARGEAWGEEKTSPTRAAAKLTGEMR